MLKDAQFKISSKSKQFFEDYEAGSEDIKLQFKNEKVCATNGIAYESECKMRIEACNLKQNIDVANMGDCGKPLLWYFNSISHVPRNFCIFPGWFVLQNVILHYTDTVFHLNQ